MQVVRVNGVELSYVSIGTGPNSLLCIPAVLGTLFSPLPATAGPLWKGWKCLFHTPRGYGKDSKVERPTENADETDAMDGLELMRFLSIKEFSVLAWCSGGRAGISLASKFPQAVKKLVIFGVRSYVTEKEIQYYETQRDISSWDTALYKPLVEIYGLISLQRLWSSRLDSLVKCYTLNNGDICTKEVSKVRCPTLIIHGQNDGMCPVFHAEYLRDHIQGSRLELIEGGRHMIQFKHQHKFNKMVEEFLKTE